MFLGRPRVVGNMHLFVPCQIDILNKQLVSPLSWNNSLSKRALGEPYILTIDRHVDIKKKHSLGVKEVYKISLHLKNTLLHVYTEIFCLNF